MDQFLNVAWSGVWLGSADGCVAIALIASFRSARLINISVGAVFVFAALLMAWLRTKGLNAPLSVGVSTVAAVAICALQERFILRRIADASPVVRLLGTLSVAIVLTGVCAVWFGRDPVTAPGLGHGIPLTIGPLHSSVDVILSVAGAFALTAFGSLLFDRTMIGHAVTAAGADAGAARMLGIDVWKLRMIAMGFAGLASGLGGALFIPGGVLDFSQGLSLTLYGFVAATVAGFERPFAALAAAIAFGVTSQLGTAYISSVFSQAIAFGILAAVVLIGQRMNFMRAIA
jgi:branched-subunit amino acid ABC-type transport system permease component